MAVRLGIVNVEKEILDSLTAKQFLEWEAYAQLEPFSELRDDYRAASIAAVIANVNRSPKHRAYTIQDFVLKFEPQAEGQPTKQTPEQQEAMMRILMGIPSEPMH